MFPNFSHLCNKMSVHRHHRSKPDARFIDTFILYNQEKIVCSFRLGQDMKPSSLYSRLNKHESLSHGSIVNLTPLHSNRSINSQTKSKRKMYKNSSEAKSFVSIPAPTSFERLEQSIDIVTERAAHLFYNGEYKNCINILNE